MLLHTAILSVGGKLHCDISKSYNMQHYKYLALYLYTPLFIFFIKMYIKICKFINFPHAEIFFSGSNTYSTKKRFQLSKFWLKMSMKRFVLSSLTKFLLSHIRKNMLFSRETQKGLKNLCTGRL